MANKIKLKQKRTFETRDKIIKAAIELISEDGYFVVTTNDVAKQAGISIGSLYSHFENKKAIMIACVAYYYELVCDNIDGSGVNKPNEDQTSFMPHLAATIDSVFQAHQIMPGFHRSMMAACLQEPELRAMEAQKEKESKQQIVLILESWKSFIKIRDISLAADMVYLMISETVHKQMNHELSYTKETLADELARLIKAYLFYEV